MSCETVQMVSYCRAFAQTDGRDKEPLEHPATQPAHRFPSRSTKFRSQRTSLNAIDLKAHRSSWSLVKPKSIQSYQRNFKKAIIEILKRYPPLLCESANRWTGGSMRVLLFDTSNYYFDESRASFTIFGVTGI